MSKRNCRGKFVPRWDEEPEVDKLMFHYEDQRDLDFAIQSRFIDERRSVGVVIASNKEVYS